MGMLAEIVVAVDDDAEAIWEAVNPTEDWPGVETKGLFLVHLATLWAILTEEPDTVVDRAGQFETLIDPEDEDEGPWVFEWPPDFETALAAVQPAAVPAAAQRWSQSEEMQADGWHLAGVTELVETLVQLAKTARQDGKLMMLKISL